MSFKQFKAATKVAAKTWEESRQAESGGGTQFVEVPDGNYIVRLEELSFGSSTNKENKEVPYAQFTMVVATGPHMGSRIRHRVRFEEVKGTTRAGKPFEITMQDCADRLARNLKSFMAAEDVEELDFDDLDDVASELNETNPACKVGVKSRGDWQNVYTNDAIDDENLPPMEELINEDDDDDDDDEPVDDDDDDEVVDASDDEDDDDEEDDEDEDEEEDFKVEKGDTVTAQPGRTKKTGKYKVMTVSQRNQTCTLKRVSDDRVFKGVPWDSIQS